MIVLASAGVLATAASGAVAMEVAPSTLAGIITAFATLVTALGGLVLAFSVVIPMRRKVGEVNQQVDTIHTIVNQQRTDAQRYNIALTELLKKNGIEVPIDQSLPVVGEGDAQPGQPTGEKNNHG